ncbi:WD repeat-containing protein 6 isoform X1 [Sorghum bicolor]|uniref:Uncharacterized protein n=2 Tax=Sorghum bicolor TaxID=4558 RepID=C5X139_SORBI|nr:WD repeat-containing protein 6 isoform X1 [Sorghum bicolor]EER95656.1 hypothetical protein SORBI_3001G535100 [Sorghum bicolor]|eukprot:XP_002468658.1 WD repeat-containing protein 6 isoform X1 [Sorghum bicolor]
MAAGGHLRPGSYLGDVSALSFLPSSPHPLLLAGTGSQLLLYEVGAARLVASFRVFDGVRVHGIEPRSGGPDSYTLAVFGERRVKLFSLRFGAEADGGEVDEARLELEQRLPGFDHWVLDARFLEVDGLLAIGLSDNSVTLWDLSKCSLVTRVKSPEKCLLYSMRMWGDSVGELLVASGTILNEILIWKLASQVLGSSMVCSNEGDTSDVNSPKIINLDDNQHMTVHLGRLKEHEGSIFRIAWSSDGSKFMSVSDDRSARVWMLTFKSQGSVNQTASQDNVEIIPKLTLFGHSARIWDCYVSDSMVITAGEDCTCCIWGMDGKLIKMFKEHIGRGIWRCLFDPSSLIVVTAGFDSAIKVHYLCNSIFHDIVEDKRVSDGLNYDSEIFVVSSPSVSGQYGPLDSKSEYVRCLHFAEENILYVATNNGYLHHAELSNIEDVRWTEIIQVTEKAPIICMDVMTTYSNLSLNREDTIALGDGRGNVTIVRLTSGSTEPKLDLSFTWSAEKDRQLLGVYWCKALECSHIFTADPRGVLKLWNIRDALFSSTDIINTPQMFPLVAVFESSFGARIMCLDASPGEEILIAGDKKGNITAFPFPKTSALHASGLMQQKMLPCDRFKGAHGISSVASVHIKDSISDHIEIHTTGGDGCICLFKYGRNVQKIEFFGMRQVKELGTIQSIYTNLASESQLSSTYAIGFTSADFIIWDLENETKMAQVSCGGWRRPYSYYLGTVPEYQNCFAFVKDHHIHIHRHWAPTHDKKLLPQVLHLQFHGREVHSLCFIDPASHSDPENNSDLLVATGCEDGTVRLTGFLTGSSGKWHSSKLLGEHVGGSAVRATCFIPRTYTVTCKSYNDSLNGISDGIAVEKDETFLLISVGSKQVLTTWILQPRNAENRQVCSSGLDIDSKQNAKNLENVDSAMSFQWLTTHMPSKLPRNGLKSGHIKQSIEEGNSSVVQPNMDIVDHMENDWRYLSVTAFHLKHPLLSRLTVCFVVVACSDATVVLRALLLPSRLWFDVALLVPQASPVLVLRHIIINAGHYKDDAGDRYLIVSGSTDGSITFWNLTETIHGFMQLISETQPHMNIDCQKRPRTGRGSQGGRRRWRSLAYALKKRDGDMSPSNESNLGSLNAAENSPEASGVENTQTIVHEASDSSNTEMPSSTQSCDIPELRPMHLLSGVHQSGVNCLHISYSTPDKSYCIISGGDDQAVQCFNFRVVSSEDCLTTTTRLNSHDNDTLKILYQHKASSAHSAAVKGIWTDGTWAFSTGLDQRVRCWKMGLIGQFTEYSHAIISVPEPETLDVFHDRAKRKYHIAVAGRGMQMVEFSPPGDV